MHLGIVTGVTGQDGSFLVEFLLKKGYKVIGLVRRTSLDNLGRLKNITDENFELVETDMCDPMANNRILNTYQNYDRIEIYNLAAQSHVQTSFEQPMYTFQVNTMGVLGWLEAIRQSPAKDKIRFYQAGTSEMYGKVQEIPQTENTHFYPRSPYGVSKLSAFWLCKNYRESYGLFITNGILFNHESERRGDQFVTQKIVKGLINYFVKDGPPVELGNLEAKRDWGYAPDYVEGMWMMMQADEPDDFVLATGQTRTVKDFINECIEIGGWNTEWVGDTLLSNGKTVIFTSDKFKRPAEVDILVGDASKAKQKLGWTPKTSFKEMVRYMFR